MLRGIISGHSDDSAEDATCIRLAYVQGCEPTHQLVECELQLACGVFLGTSGVPLVGPQEEPRGPSGYTPRGFTSSQERGRRSKDFQVLYQQTNNKQTNKQTSCVLLRD